MRKLLLLLTCCAALSACVTPRPVVGPALPWDQRLIQLQRAGAWSLDGRAAVTVGTQGWQASLNWRQRGSDAVLHLSGPLGVGAMMIEQTPAGLSLNGAPPSDAVLSQLQERLGFDLPLKTLRFWLLGVPDPDSPFDLSRNDQDRARQLTQDGWSVAYDRYLPVAGDSLPTRLVLSRDTVKVKIAVDHWENPR